jgi:hypothetical protein
MTLLVPTDVHLDSNPIIDELYEVREKLVEKHQGNFHLYSVAARAHAIQLGFQFEYKNFKHA